MNKAEFQKRRTEIISEMLDNPDEIGIYPTTKCFERLDQLFDEIAMNTKKPTQIAASYHKRGNQY